MRKVATPIYSATSQVIAKMYEYATGPGPLAYKIFDDRLPHKSRYLILSRPQKEVLYASCMFFPDNANWADFSNQNKIELTMKKYHVTIILALFKSNINNVF